MFKDLLQGMLSAIAVKLLDRYRQLSMQWMKIEAAKAYVRGVQMARLTALGVIGLGFLITLIAVGVLLFHAGLFILLPWSLEAKAILGMALGLAYMIAGGLVLRRVMDGRTWLDQSGATRMLEEAIGNASSKSDVDHH
jgi:hypothetical protein